MKENNDAGLDTRAHVKVRFKLNQEACHELSRHVLRCFVGIALGPLARPAPEARPSLLDPRTVFELGLRNHHIANTAYPIGHRTTIWKYRRAASDHEQLCGGIWAARPQCVCTRTFLSARLAARSASTAWSMGMMSTEKPSITGVCSRKFDLYVERLGLGGKTLCGFDIGGGTPALVAPWRISELVSRVRDTFDLAPGFGISIETTPRWLHWNLSVLTPTVLLESTASAWACRWSTRACCVITAETYTMWATTDGLLTRSECWISSIQH